MADSSRVASSSRIAFTLPISCQICLGKVKQPVVCPNQHAFCSPCMDIWLQRNQQCPSCRIEITSENPCKKILGGLSHNEEEESNFAKNKELRRSRLELLCKDYEDEIERLEMENEALVHEKTILEEQVKSNDRRRQRDGDDDCENAKASTSSSSSSGPDMNMLMVLTKKLHDATGLYEKVKKDMDRLKQENSNVKDENATLGRENQRLRMELVGRSPRKFGRFTVATLETQLEKQKKETNQLQKALERSDAYIEDIEQELEGFRKSLKQQSMCVHCKVSGRDADDTFEMDVKEKINSRKESDHENLKCEKLPISYFELGRTSKNDSSSGSCKIDYGRERQKQSIDKFGTSDALPDWKKLPINKVMEEKNAISVINFYGKKPLVKSLDEETPEVSSSKGKYTKTTPEKTYKSCDTSSFDLEMPSMNSPCSSDSLNRIDRIAIDSNDSLMEKDSKQFFDRNHHDDKDAANAISPAQQAKKKLKFETSDVSDVSGMSFFNSPEKDKVENKKEGHMSKQVTFNRNVSVKNMMRNKNTLNDSVLDVTLPSDTSEVDVLNDLKANANHDDTFDINNSMNSDIMDCMELFDSAERRLGQIRNTVVPKSALKPVASSSKEPGQELPSSSSDLGESLPSGGTIANGYQNAFPLPTQAQSMSQFNTGPIHTNGFDGINHTSKTFSEPFGMSIASWSAPYPQPSVTSSSQNRMHADNPGRNPVYPGRSSSTSGYQSANHTGSTRHETFTSESRPDFSSGALGSFTGSGYNPGSSVSNLPKSGSSMSESVQSHVPFPSRPASTSTLHNMLQTLNSIDAEHTRPSSAPGVTPLPVPDYRSGPSSNLKPDFHSSLSTLPSMSRSVPSGFDPSMFGSNLPRMAGVDTTRGLSASQSSIPGSSVSGLTGGHHLPMGMGPGLPGGSFPGFGLSQPAFGLGNDFGRGGNGPYGHNFGSSSSFGGGMTQ